MYDMSLDNRYKFALPYWARPGIATFAKKVESQGGGDEDDDDEEDDEGEDDDEEDDDEDDLADLTDDELKAELRKTRAQLEGANGSASRHRKARRAAEAELAKRGATPKPKTKAKGDDSDAPDADAIRGEVEREVTAKANDRIKRVEARAAFIDAGVPKDQAADLAAFVKLDDLDLDDDGNVEGLDQEVDRIRKKYPSFFAKKTVRRKSVAGDGDRNGEDRKSKRALTPSQAQAAKLTGRSR